MKRKPTIFEAVSCILFMIGVIGIGFIYLNLPMQALLILSAVYAGCIASRLGVSWKRMENTIIKNLGKAMPSIFIIFSSGIVIGTWMYSGTVPMIIYYGLKLINPKLFFVSSFLIVSMISMVTGTAWGSIATVGMALMAMASGFGINLSMSAGAIIAGGVLGDKLSPLSDTTNLSSLVTGVDLFSHIKHMLYTTIPATIIGIIVYFIIGMNIEVSLESQLTIEKLLHNLDLLYSWNTLHILPVLILFVGAIKRKPTVLMMLLSSVVAIFIGKFCNGFSFSDGVQSMVTGFHTEMIPNHIINISNNTYIISLLGRGGMMEMTPIVITIFCGYAFAGILEEDGCLDVILGVVYSKVKNINQLFLITVIGSIILVTITGVASIPILMIGSLLTDAYVNMGLHPKNLSRTLEDAGTGLVPFIPWGSSGIFYSQILGVTPLQYGIWLIPCYLCVIICMIYATTGICIAKISYHESKQYLEKILLQEKIRCLEFK